MTERLSAAPVQGLLAWLRERNLSSNIAWIGGMFQPSPRWAEGGTGWLWVESAGNGEPQGGSTQELATMLGFDVQSMDRGHHVGVSMPARDFLALLMNLVESAEQERCLSPSLTLLVKCARLSLKVVESHDVMAFASPCDSSWVQILDSLYQFSGADVQEWLPWSTHSKQFCAAWIPAWTRPELRALRHVYIGMMDAFSSNDITTRAGRTLSQRPALQRTQALFSAVAVLDPWICVAVDWWMRQVLVEKSSMQQESSKSPYHVPYRGEKDLLDVWSKALWSGDSQGIAFDADAWLIWRTLRQDLMESGWRAEWLQDRSGSSHYHLDLELCPPAVATVSPGDWTLVYHIAHNHWPVSAPLSDWWKTDGRTWRIGNDVLVKPDTWILPLLHQVGAVFPPAQQGLAKPGPSDCTVPSDQVFEFVTTILPRLQALGCTCRIPALNEETLGNIRVRVQVRRAGAKGRGPQMAAGRATGMFDAEQLVAFDWTVVVGDETISRADFDAMVEQNSPFVQLGGSWRLLPVQAIMDQVRLLGASNKVGSVNLLQLSRAVLMSDAPENEAVVRLEVAYEEEDMDLDIRRTLDILSHADEPAILPVPGGFQGSLRLYQQVGYSWLVHLRSIGCGGCLADDMGLGKTIQVIAYLLHVKDMDPKRGPHLLLCPTSLLQNWKSELSRFAPSLRVHVHHGAARNESELDEESSLERAASDHDLIITTYGTVVRDLSWFGEVAWDAVIADEAQNIKNHDTKQAQAVRSLPSSHRIALTGTPVENRLEELWSIFQFVNPGYLGSLAWFRRVFAQPISVHPDAPSARQLHRLLRPVLLRRRKTEPEIQLELPEKWEVNEYAGLTPEQAALYQSVLNRLFGQMEEIRSGGQTAAMARRGHILSALVRLKQVCDHPCLLVGGTGEVGRSGKLKLLTDILEDVVVDGEAALVFTQFRDMGELLCDVIEQRFGTRPRFLHGGLSASARGQLVEAFQSEQDPSPVLVLSLKAGGVGLNLTRANHVFHYDRWWNPAVEDQATDRAFRIGQTRDVQVHKIICSGTLEERIDALIQSKRAVSAAVIGESEGWVTELDDDALRQLFALDADVGMEVDDGS